MRFSRGILFSKLMFSLLLAGAQGLFVPSGAWAQQCQPVQECGDVDASGKVGTTDALKVLKTAVGQQQSLVCTCSAGDDSCEGELQTCNSDLTQCGDDLAACEGTPPDSGYDPIVVCGTDKPGDKFTLEGKEYVIVETDVRLEGTDRRYALRLPILFGTNMFVRHYTLAPFCENSYDERDCPSSSAILDVCGKTGVAWYSYIGGSYHTESVVSASVSVGEKGWFGGHIFVEEGYSPLFLPALPYNGAESLPTPTLAAQGWSLLNEVVEEPEVFSYEMLREFYSHVSIREL